MSEGRGTHEKIKNTATSTEKTQTARGGTHGTTCIIYNIYVKYIHEP